MSRFSHIQFYPGCCPMGKIFFLKAITTTIPQNKIGQQILKLNRKEKRKKTA